MQGAGSLIAISAIRRLRQVWSFLCSSLFLNSRSPATISDCVWIRDHSGRTRTPPDGHPAKQAVSNQRVCIFCFHYSALHLTVETVGSC
jgi:hypothetical protein